MTLETAFELIQALGWRLHVLSSYPSVSDTRLLWGASIRVSDWVYGHSINQPNPAAAIEVALADAQDKSNWEHDVRAKIRTVFETRQKPIPITLDSIFGKDAP